MYRVSFPQLLSIVAGALALIMSVAEAGTEETLLYSFSYDKGMTPVADGLISDASGNLYGTALPGPPRVPKVKPQIGPLCSAHCLHLNVRRSLEPAESSDVR